MSKLFDGIKEGLTKANAPQQLQDQINAMIKDAVATADTAQARPYQQISLSIVRLLKSYAKYFPEKAERLIAKIIETNQFVLTDFTGFEQEAANQLKQLKRDAGMIPSWIIPAQVLGGLLGFVIGFVGIMLVSIPFTLAFDFKLGQPFFVFVAGPAGWWVAKDFYRGIADMVADGRIPKVLANAPDQVAAIFLLKAVINLLRFNYLTTLDMKTITMAVSDATVALALYKPDATADVVRAVVSALEPVPVISTESAPVQS